MNTRTNKQAAGFTIIEIIVVIVIIGILAAMIGPRLIDHVDKSKVATAQTNASTLATAVTSYRVDTGEYPASLEDLWAKPSGVSDDKWRGKYLQNEKALVDPWGNKFVLRIPPRDNADFEVVSFGADGAEGGTGVNADIVKP